MMLRSVCSLSFWRNCRQFVSQLQNLALVDAQFILAGFKLQLSFVSPPAVSLSTCFPKLDIMSLVFSFIL
jgi:hypothetical protein